MTRLCQWTREVEWSCIGESNTIKGVCTWTFDGNNINGQIISNIDDIIYHQQVVHYSELNDEGLIAVRMMDANQEWLILAMETSVSLESSFLVYLSFDSVCTKATYPWILSKTLKGLKQYKFALDAMTRYSLCLGSMT